VSRLRVDGTTLQAQRRAAGPLGTLLEPKKGYRFGPENLTIGAILPPSARRVLDIGAGCGVLGLAARQALEPEETLLLEQNPDLCAFARANALGHDTVRVVEGDALKFREERSDIDLVTTNPPFFAAGSGRESDNKMVRDATHTHMGDLPRFLEVANRVLSPAGQVVVLYPAAALSEALVALARVGLIPNALALVFARHTSGPFRVWIRADRVGAPIDAPVLLSPAGLSR